ncbi:hypothetical protein VTK73DRAFT_8239 [Phialemonium thermophilum]|uniref:RCC1-like domain-containing protein n=1 Tax=Phialemonium thermophilum TaxID=223376 RepID=A0ABR3XQL1_9PEZI
MPRKQAESPADAKKRAAPVKEAYSKKPAPPAKSKSTGTAAATAASAKNNSKKRKAEEDPTLEDASTSRPKKTKVAASKAKATPAPKTAAKKRAGASVEKKAGAAPTKSAAAANANINPAAKRPRSKTPAKKDESDKENETLPATPAAANIKRKRAPSEAVEAEVAPEAEGKVTTFSKKAKKVPEPKTAAISKRKIGRAINEAPTAPLDVFVFGEGSSGELGLGSEKVDGKKPIDVKRPRLNHNLSSKTVGVVQIACGGMHVVALTKDNKILTWGVNDQGALGRDTTWEGGLRDVDAEDSESEDSDDTGMNPKESTPAEVDMTGVDPETKFVQVVASDSASFALTEDGCVYGWGTFRSSDGILGFTENILIQRTPMFLPDLKGIKQLAAGSNHILALDKNGKVQAWGCGQQNQLGRKVFEREIKLSLRPKGIGNLPVRGAKPALVACGSYHSFVVDQKGRVFAWGLNNYAELGIEDEAGEDDAAQLKPRLVESLADYRIAGIAGGEHHSLACTEDGKLLTWGRIDGHQVGLPSDVFNEENAIFDDHGKPRILKRPTVVPGVPPVASVAAGTDHSFALTQDGKAYSWGFSANYQTGQGSDDDVEVPTLIDNTAVRDKKLVFAGAGGQYSVLAAVAEQ